MISCPVFVFKASRRPHIFDFVSTSLTEAKPAGPVKQIKGGKKGICIYINKPALCIRINLKICSYCKHGRWMKEIRQ